MFKFREDYIFYETLAGSHLYGTNVESSDTDYRGIFILPKEHRLDLFNNFEQQEFPEEDRVVYSFEKFLKLAADCNPNIIELLFANEEAIQTDSEFARILRHQNRYFISNKCKDTFIGYAVAQLKKIERHQKWVKEIPKPDRKDFGLEEMPKFGFEKLLAILNSPEEAIRPEYIEYAVKEMNYRSHKGEYDNYITWKKERNEKRFELESSFGYDTKHASHLIRLLKEGIELVNTGKIVFPLTYKDELLDIRNGKYTYKEIIEWAEQLKEQLNKSPDLKGQPDYPAINIIYRRLCEVYDETGMFNY